jgi:hypothetical protein
LIVSALVCAALFNSSSTSHLIFSFSIPFFLFLLFSSPLWQA